MSKGLLFIATLIVGGVAQAESFYCAGSGKYASAFAAQVVELQWPSKAQKVLQESKDQKILVDLDKSNTSTHYLEISVYKRNQYVLESATSAKGSLHDMVMFMEMDGTQFSAINCVPIKK